MEAVSHKSALLILNVSIVSEPVIIVSYLSIIFFSTQHYSLNLELLFNLVLLFITYYYFLNLVLIFSNLVLFV